MKEAGIPTARHWTATTEKNALSVLNEIQHPLVVKVDGLAAGKGVTVAETINETSQAIKDAFQGKYGTAGARLVLEERLKGLLYLQHHYQKSQNYHFLQVKNLFEL